MVTIRPVTLRFSEQITEGVRLIGFRRDFSFTAGQVIGIALEKEGPRRLYTICSGERDDEVKILFDVVREGYLTPRLAGLRAGDAVWITEPRGEFTCRPEERAVWVASGTGVAPFYAMCRSHGQKNKILIHGSRFLARFYFRDEFSSLLGKGYIRCCTAERDPYVFHGRVTDFLAECQLPPADTKYYLCGSAEMVVDSRDMLIGRGVPFGQIISEIYF